MRGMMGEVLEVRFCAGNCELVLVAGLWFYRLTRFNFPEVTSATSTYLMMVLQSGQDCRTSSQLSRHR